MAVRIFHCLFTSVALIAGAGRASAGEASAFEAQFRPFLDRHCVVCHGLRIQKGKVRLDKLPRTFGDKDTAATWVKVLDRLHRGDMPPKSKPRPPEKDLRAAIAGLQQQLRAASLGTQRREGRVALRRLNRTEYENTLRDLLGVPVEVKELLPNDNISAGFDKVGAALDVSGTHLLRYQDSAEKALRLVVPDRPLQAFKERRTGRKITEEMPHFRQLLGKSMRLNGDTLVMYVRPAVYRPCATATAPQTGRYRVRASVHTVGTKGRPLPVMCSCRGLHPGEVNEVRWARVIRDVPANRVTIVEGQFELKKQEMIFFAGWSLPDERQFDRMNQPLDKYQGPGLAVQWVEMEGPLDAWPPAGYRRLFAGVPLQPKSVAQAEAKGRPAPPEPAKPSWFGDPLVAASAKPRQDAERLMRSFLPQAFRRPVSEELQRYYVKIVHAELAKGLSFQNAMLLGYKAVLCSPHFLFLVEPANASRSEQPTTLDDYAIASRLSYFLWSSMPDRELLERAAKGELKKPEVLRSQVERLLDDPKANRFVANFTAQWLDLGRINATMPDAQIYGEFDDFLFWSMPRETELFFREILRGDLSLTNFIHSDWTFLNQRLAQHYGIPNVAGGELRKVRLPLGSHRGGVLTHASILKVTADGTRTSPVLRGKWVLERILGQPPAPPPADVAAIEPDIRGATTIRQQLDKHRNTAACASCHRHIDPPGFALENFDVIGGWREFYRSTTDRRTNVVDLANYPGRTVLRGLDVEKGGRTPDGRAFKDIDEYKQQLLADKDQLVRNLAQKLLIYATGADIQFADREVVEQLVSDSRKKGFGLRSLIHDVVQTRVFLNK